MADNKSREITLKVNTDLSEMITALKAVQREAKKATQAVAELDGVSTPKREFTVVIVDSPEMAHTINRGLPYASENPQHYIQFYAVGQAFCGLSYHGLRPTKVIRAHKPLTTEAELEWESACLATILRPDERAKLNTESPGTWRKEDDRPDMNVWFK